MKINESQKLRVLVASNGSRDIAKALALVVRLSKNPNIETRAIVDEESWPAHRLSQETLALQNRYFRSTRGTDEAQKSIERSQIEFYKQQAYELCDWADMLVLAPIDADTFAKMLHGITDCLLLEILRGWDVSKKILLVPGMTTAMWENPMTKKQLSKVRRKWQWIRVMQPILWHFDGGRPPKERIVWDGFNELVEVIKNQAELKSIGHDVDVVTAGAGMLARYNMKTDALLPAEIWTLVFQHVGDWETAEALNIYTTLPVPPEWQYRPDEPKDELNMFMRSLEWTILTQSTENIIDKLKDAPDNMKFLSSLCVKLVIKLCLVELLHHLEINFKDVFWFSFGQKLLPTKASAVYERTEILEWWRTSSSFSSKDYTAEVIDGASISGFVQVLDWWRRSGLPLKYTESALEQASSKGHILVLEWWKQASYGASLTIDRDRTTMSPEVQPALRLKPGKSLLAAAQNNQVLVLRWWESAGIPVLYSESVAKVASAQGHVEVLDAWRELKGEEMEFDYKVLVEPTENRHVNVLEWWKNLSQGVDGRPGPKVEYRACDIQEALDGIVGSEESALEVKQWWEQNGLNSRPDDEWMEVHAL
ncbi:hypothetical protein EG329_013732 [Mollisiaceae sp. DMI_Dod_QoI]|nr:hypothetical protein EG329_013732 [Helotiales sp. DMI_Dod_QoI]